MIQAPSRKPMLLVGFALLTASVGVATVSGLPNGTPVGHFGPGCLQPGALSAWTSLFGFEAGVLHEYGDAPDNSYLKQLTSAYVGGGSPVGRFPTLSATANAPEPGARHRHTGAAWLGDDALYPAGVWPLLAADDPAGLERDANAHLDLDAPVTNLDGALPDRDGRDGGVRATTASTNGFASLVVRVSAADTVGPWYLNVLADWNFDGEWRGADPNGAPEWAVQNALVFGLAGTSFEVATPAFATGSIAGTPWIRVTLSDSPIDPLPYGPQGWDGSVPAGTLDAYGLRAFECGETEDHCGALTLVGVPGLPVVSCGSGYVYDCSTHAPFAILKNLSSGTFTASAASWSWTGATGLWLSAATLSMNGYFEANLDIHCLDALDFTLVKTFAPAGSSPTGPKYSATDAPLLCATGPHTHHVPVGLDYGEYELTVKWTGCDGTAGAETVTLLVYDPPVFGG